jgi:hypothetical protein
MPIRLIHSVAFDAETTQLLGLAYERAAAALAPDDRAAREAVARRIIEAARRGERDFGKLVEYGIRNNTFPAAS